MAAGDLITADYEIEWRGVLWGHPATSWGITNLSGWYDYTLRGSNADRPGRHGTHVGEKRANERTVEVELTAAEDDTTLLPALRRATALTEDPVEEELVIRAGDDQPRYVLARLERRAIPTDHEWSVGHHRAVLQWVCSDPKRFSVAENSSGLIGLPEGAAAGITFPVTFPADFGTGGTPNSAVVTNAGDAPTWPIFTITGPVTGPAITDGTSGAVLRFASSFEVEAGQALIIDTDARSVTLDGVGRSGALTVREWFPLLSGDTLITFTASGAYDPAAGLTVTWRDAWI